MEINYTPNINNIDSIRLCNEKIEIDGLLYGAEELSDLTHKVCKTFADQIPSLVSFYEKIESCLYGGKFYKWSDERLWYDVLALVAVHRRIQQCFACFLEIENTFSFPQRLDFVNKYQFDSIKKIKEVITLQDTLIKTGNLKDIKSNLEAIYVNSLSILIKESTYLRVDLTKKICSSLLQMTILEDVKEVPYTVAGYHLFHYAASIGSKSYVSLAQRSLKEKRNILESLLNGLTAYGLFSPLEMALSYKQSKFAIALIKAGANLWDENESLQTPLHLAAIHNDFEALEYLLQQSQEVNLLKKQDVYGRTYQDYSLKTDHLPPSIEQSVIVEKVAKYLLIVYEREQKKLEQEKIEYSQVIYEKKQKILKDTYFEITQGKCFGTKNGACNGFVFLFGYYAFRGLSEEFFRILESISAWDGQEKSLQQSLIHENFSGKYATLEELLEYWSNYIIWFQANYDDVQIAGDDCPLKWQSDRCEQFDFVKKSPDFHLDCLFRLNLHLRVEQLDELLMVLSYLPNLYIDIGGEQHVVAPYISSDYKTTYYDPNLKFRTRVLSSQEIAKTIQNLKYRALGKKWKKMNISLCGYRFSEGNDRICESKTPKELLENKSIQNLGPLHLSIIFNDRELLLQQLEKNPTCVNEKGIFGTPLQLCHVWKRAEMFEIILRHQSFDPKVDVHSSIWTEVREMGFLDFYKLAVENEEVVISKHEFFSLIRGGKVELVDLFLSVPSRKHLVNKCYIETPLIVAIYAANLEMIKCLIKNGADFNVKGLVETGLSALQMMAQLGKKELIRGLLHYLEEVNLQDVKKSIENAIEKFM